MSRILKDHENKKEIKYVIDQEKEFKIKSLASKELAEWAANKLYLPENKINKYSNEIIEFNIRNGSKDTVAKIFNDLKEKEVKIEIEEINQQFLTIQESIKNKMKEEIINLQESDSLINKEQDMDKIIETIEKEYTERTRKNKKESEGFFDNLKNMFCKFFKK